MKPKSLIFAICLSLLAVTGCRNTVETDSKAQMQTEDSTAEVSAAASSSSAFAPNTELTEEDQNDSWSDTGVSTIIFQGMDITAEGSGMSITGSTITISQAGTYLCTGTLEDGQLCVDAGKDDLVRLIFQDVHIISSETAPVYIKQAAKTIITLASGTSSSCTDGTDYTGISSEDTEPNAAIFSKDDLTINGSGSLTVNGNHKNGIASKDHLIIIGGTITVHAEHDGIRGKDSLSIYDSTLEIYAGSDGLKSHNSSDSEKGWISLDGGNIQITSGNDAIQAETALQIASGTFQIISGGGSSASGDTTESSKGLKAGEDISIAGGDFTIDSYDDTIHSNGNVTIDGGTFHLTSGDDGIHADTALVINDGEILVAESYEGLEGYTIDINGGTIEVTASDDGINAAGGTDSSSSEGSFGKDHFQPGRDENIYIRITGGSLTVHSSGDGIDSNGNLYFDGGAVMVHGPTSNGDAAIDYDGSCEVNGGILIAAGSSGMAQAPGNSSSQPVFTITYDTLIEENSEISFSDTEGNLLFSFTPEKSVQHIVFSHSDLTEGNTYTIRVNSITTELTLNGLVTSAAQDGSESSGRGFGGRNDDGRPGKPPGDSRR